MAKKSLLKRMSYFSLAFVLMLASVPMIPGGKAYADDGGCDGPTDVTELAAAVKTESAVTLCGDISGGVNIGHAVSGDVEVSLNLNGHSITATSGKALIVSSNASVVISGAGTINGGVQVNGELTIGSGTYTSNINVFDGGDLTINGGIFNAALGLGQRTAGTSQSITINGGTFGGATIADLIYANPANSELTINGGDFTGVSGAVSKGGKLDAVATMNGGTYNKVSVNAADGKTYYKVDEDLYTIADAPDMSSVPARMMVRVGEATDVDGVKGVFDDSEVSVSRLGTFADGQITATGVGTFDIAVRPEVYNKDGRDKTYDKKVKVHSYDLEEANVVLPVGEDETLAEGTVKYDTTWDKREYSVEDESIATIDEDGKVTAVTPGQTDIYATISIATIPDVNAREKVGTIYVYSFDSIEENYLTRKGGNARINVDSTWDLTAETAETDIVKINPGTDVYKVKGLSAGLANVTFKATVNGVEKSKDTKVYVYEVNGEELIVKKGDTISEDEITQLINKGHDDVSMRVKKFSTEGIVSNDGLALTGEAAGQTEVTYRLSVGENDAHANVPIKVYVWEFVTENLEDEYDLGNLKTSTTENEAFEVYDEGGEISYTITDANGAETTDIALTETDGKYTIGMADGAKAGEYTVTFTDTVAGQEVASKSIKVRVHEITTTAEDGHYIVMTRNPFNTSENQYDFKVTETNGFTANRDITYQKDGSSFSGIDVQYRHGGNWRVTARQAGAYEITFGDEYASTTITIYVMQFSFEQDSYHVRREDGMAGEVIKAINSYWHDVNVANRYDDTEFVMVNDENGEVVARAKYGVDPDEEPMVSKSGKYEFNWCVSDDDCLEAGNYTITFKAYANRGDEFGGKTATKQVRFHIYEMVAPEEDLYIIYTGDTLNIDVYDLNNRGTVRAQITSGPTGGLNFGTNGFWPFMSTDYSRLTAAKPGVYTVRYSDRMDNNERTLVDAYEATIIVLEPEEETVYVRRGEIANLTGSESWSASFATDDATGEDYEAEGGVIVFNTKDMDLGEHELYIAHDFSEYDEGEFPPRELVKITTVVVWDVVGDAADDMVSDEDRAAVADFVAGKITEMLENDSTVDADEQISLDYNIDKLKEKLAEGEEITTRLEISLIDEEDWEWYAEAYDEVVLKIEDESGIVAMYSVFIRIYVGEERAGFVYELDEPITLKLEIPEEYRTVADGYTREFSVVRGHMALDGTETAEEMEVTREGDYLVFLNNKFSSFALSFADSLIPVAPETGFVTSEGYSAVDNNLVALITGIIATITMAGVAVFAKRK